MFRKLYVMIVTVLAALKTLPGLKKVKKMDSSKFLEKKELISKITKQFGDTVMKASGADIILKGEENIPHNETVLYVSNHLSLFDIPLLLKVIPDQVGFIAKIELKKVPIVNSWITEMNGSFLDRQNIRQALRIMKKAIEILKMGNCLVIFPQGTREKEERVPFKSGSFSIARNAHVLVVPIAISGTNNILNGNAKKSGIRITFLKNFYISSQDNINDIAKGVEEEIRGELENHKLLIKNKSKTKPRN